jgi:hypothetical protein
MKVNYFASWRNFLIFDLFYSQGQLEFRHVLGLSSIFIWSLFVGSELKRRQKAEKKAQEKAEKATKVAEQAPASVKEKDEADIDPNVSYMSSCKWAAELLLSWLFYKLSSINRLQ